MDGGAVARTTARATTAPVMAVATTQPAPRLVSALLTVSPRRRGGGPAAGAVAGEVAAGCGEVGASGCSGGSGVAECSCSSMSAHLTVGGRIYVGQLDRAAGAGAVMG